LTIEVVVVVVFGLGSLKEVHQVGRRKRKRSSFFFPHAPDLMEGGEISILGLGLPSWIGSFMLLCCRMSDMVVGNLICRLTWMLFYRYVLSIGEVSHCVGFNGNNGGGERFG
jgi:hypothetical protein